MQKGIPEFQTQNAFINVAERNTDVLIHVRAIQDSVLKKRIIVLMGKLMGTKIAEEKKNNNRKKNGAT